MISKIENAIIMRINGSALKPFLKTVDSYDKVLEAVRSGRMIGNLPGVFVSFESGSARRATMSKFKMETEFNLFVIAQSLRSTKDARQTVNTGAYAIVESLLALFSFNDLKAEDATLKNSPLNPVAVDQYQDAEDMKSGLAMYGVRFTTSFVIDPVNDEAADDLLKVYLSYNLQPDDGTVDANDDMTRPAASSFTFE